MRRSIRVYIFADTLVSPPVNSSGLEMSVDLTAAVAAISEPVLSIQSPCEMPVSLVKKPVKGKWLFNSKAPLSVNDPSKRHERHLHNHV